MFKLKNIVVTNGTTHCKLKQDSKIVLFNSNTLIWFTNVSCIFMRNNELPLLNSRRTDSSNISLFVVFIILIMQYNVAWQRWISLNSHNNTFYLYQILDQIQIYYSPKETSHFLRSLMCICIIIYNEHTLPRPFINGIAFICKTAANTLQQLHHVTCYAN